MYLLLLTRHNITFFFFFFFLLLSLSHSISPMSISFTFSYWWKLSVKYVHFVCSSSFSLSLSLLCVERTFIFSARIKQLCFYSFSFLVFICNLNNEFLPYFFGTSILSAFSTFPNCTNFPHFKCNVNALILYFSFIEMIFFVSFSRRQMKNEIK